MTDREPTPEERLDIHEAVHLAWRRKLAREGDFLSGLLMREETPMSERVAYLVKRLEEEFPERLGVTPRPPA